jgi:hypothetical protein
MTSNVLHLSRYRRRREAAPVDTTIRAAGPADAEAIARLAALDSTRPPAGDVLLAEVDGEPWAAVSVDDGHIAADPFRPTRDVTLRLVEHGREVRTARRRAARRHSGQPRPGGPLLAG